MTYEIPLLMAVAYIMGSLSFARIITRALKQPDPSQVGSKNPGATNVLRSSGKKVAAWVLLADMGKGALAVLVAQQFHLSLGVQASVAFMAFLGHVYPVFHRFEGGKGVATALGGLLGLSLVLGSGVAVTWLVVAVWRRYSSLAAICAAFVAPFYAYALLAPAALPGISLMVALLLWRHKGNIRRLLAGEEPKIGQISTAG